jgi:hypothetical protein
MRNPKFTDELNELISDYANEAFDTGIAFGFNLSSTGTDAGHDK